MNKEEILYNEIYERTKDFGRTHFIKEIMRLQREYQQLKEIEKEHQKMNGELRVEIKEYQKELEKADSITQSCIFNGKKESKISYRKALNKLEKTNKANKELKDRIDKIVEIIEKEIESLKDKKRMIMQILTPENGYLKTDVEYEIKRLERYLEILKGGKQ